MKKNLVKYTMMLLLIGTGAILYISAQNSFRFRKVKKIENTTQEEVDKPEDIGDPTGDDPWKEMEKLISTYYNIEGVTYKGLVNLIDDNGDKEKLIEEHKFEYSVSGKNIYYKLGNMEFVIRPNMVLVADHNGKFITVSQQQVNHNTKKLFDVDEFRNIMMKTNAVAKVTQLGNQKMLTIENIPDAQIQGYRIYYDAITYHINKMLIGMVRLSPLTDDESGIDQEPGFTNNESDNDPFSKETGEEGIETYTYYMEIIYKEMKLLGTPEKEFKPEGKFIIITGDKIQLVPDFSNYQLIKNGVIENETKNISEDQN